MSHLAALRRQAEVEHIPLAVALELTARCNYRCPHCYIPPAPPADRLSTERVLALLDELADAGTLHLTLTGGEPLLRRDWAVVACRARQLGFDLTVFSNGALISEQAADELAALECSVEVTLASLRPELFERFTAVPGSFALTMAGIERLLARGVRLHLKVPVTTVNRLDFLEVFAFAAERGAFARADARILPRRNGDRAPLALRVPEAELEPFMQRLPTGDADCASDLDGPPCAAGRSLAYVSSTGELMGCPSLPGSDRSILDGSFAEAWASSRWLERLRAVRVGRLLPSLGPAAAYSGHCHVQALLEHGGLDRATDWARCHGELLARLEAPQS